MGLSHEAEGHPLLAGDLQQGLAGVSRSTSHRDQAEHSEPRHFNTIHRPGANGQKPIAICESRIANCRKNGRHFSRCVPTSSLPEKGGGPTVRKFL